MTRALWFVVSATLAAACAPSQDNIEYVSPVISSDPELVAISPDVEVVANNREPVFRTDTAYWLYRGGSWYRSDDLGDTWVRIVTPPRAIASITEPHRYVNYRTPEQQQLEARRAEEPKPQAPYPRPPQQVPPAVPDDPGSPDQVPRDPTLPPPPGSEPPEPNDLGRPDRMRDR